MPVLFQATNDAFSSAIFPVEEEPTSRMWVENQSGEGCHWHAVFRYHSTLVSPTINRYLMTLSTMCWDCISPNFFVIWISIKISSSVIAQVVVSVNFHSCPFNNVITIGNNNQNVDAAVYHVFNSLIAMPILNSFAISDRLVRRGEAQSVRQRFFIFIIITPFL